MLNHKPVTGQLSLDLVNHSFESFSIGQRPSDGYINATAMCQAVDKRLNNYLRLEHTQEFLIEVGTLENIKPEKLVQVKQGGISVRQGTWVHPTVATHLAQWLSPRIAAVTAKWVTDWATGKVKANAIRPPFLQRVALNYHKVSPDTFSMLVEIENLMVGRLEFAGYTLPESMLPDGSAGKIFCKLLRDKYDINTDAFDTYTHEFLNGKNVPAKLYPNELKPLFIRWFIDEWMGKRAKHYFTERGQTQAVLLIENQILPDLYYLMAQYPTIK